MTVFNLLKNVLFSMDPELAHQWALKGMQLAYRTHTTGLLASAAPAMPCTIMGLSFPNPVGLGAGFDKSADYVDALAALGFGFIEVGTLTPRPQTGNRKPLLIAWALIIKALNMR
jgi:dihydroorotate dehydrogenase